MSATAVGTKTVLAVRDLTVRYGQLTAVHEISLDVNQGELVVLLGANGAGKSSFLKTVMGLERAGEHEAGAVLLQHNADVAAFACVQALDGNRPKAPGVLVVVGRLVGIAYVQFQMVSSEQLIGGAIVHGMLRAA